MTATLAVVPTPRALHVPSGLMFSVPTMPPIFAMPSVPPCSLCPPCVLYLLSVPCPLCSHCPSCPLFSLCQTCPLCLLRPPVPTISFVPSVSPVPPILSMSQLTVPPQIPCAPAEPVPTCAPRSVYRLHERLVAIRTEYNLRLKSGAVPTVVPAVTTVTTTAAVPQRPRAELEEAPLRYLQDLMAWVEDNQQHLAAAEWGVDLPTVEAQLGSHRGLHQSIEEFRAKIDRARADEVGIAVA